MATAGGHRPSEAIEDYAKAIYALARQGDGTVATNALAERLGVTPASVSAMVKKLDERIKPLEEKTKDNDEGLKNLTKKIEDQARAAEIEAALTFRRGSASIGHRSIRN